jgi:hypothetical protein
MGNLPRSPCAPVGAFEPALNRQGCASPLPRVGQFHGGIVASPVRQPSTTNNVSFPFPKALSANRYSPASVAPSNSLVTALSVEFVAKPQEAHRAQSAIPSALAGALKEVTGFAGCLVMVSDQEARLLTVVTLWSGNDRHKRCAENARWVHALLAPYVDRRLRVQTLVAHLPLLPVLPSEPDRGDDRSDEQDLATACETVCVA